jgi:hypothetical protein
LDTRIAGILSIANELHIFAEVASTARLAAQLLSVPRESLGAA